MKSLKWDSFYPLAFPGMPLTIIDTTSLQSTTGIVAEIRKENEIIYFHHNSNVLDGSYGTIHPNRTGYHYSTKLQRLYKYIYKVDESLIKKVKENMSTINISIERVKGITSFNFKIDPKIEEIFKGMNGEVKTSEKWPGNKFYYIPELIKNQSYKDLLYKNNLIDDYGQFLVEGNKFNIGWLRTVGGEGKVKISDTLDLLFVKDLIERTNKFIREYFSSFIQDMKVTGKIEVGI